MFASPVLHTHHQTVYPRYLGFCDLPPPPRDRFGPRRRGGIAPKPGSTNAVHSCRLPSHQSAHRGGLISTILRAQRRLAVAAASVAAAAAANKRKYYHGRGAGVFWKRRKSRGGGAQQRRKQDPGGAAGVSHRSKVENPFSHFYMILRAGASRVCTVHWAPQVSTFWYTRRFGVHMCYSCLLAPRSC